MIVICCQQLEENNFQFTAAPACPDNCDRAVSILYILISLAVQYDDHVVCIGYYLNIREVIYFPKHFIPYLIAYCLVP